MTTTTMATTATMTMATMATESSASTRELPVARHQSATTAEIEAPREPLPTRFRRAVSSARTRILLWYVVLIALALIATILTVRQILLVQLEERVNAEMLQETAELEALATGTDPATGQPFNSVEALFTVFLTRNIPKPRETMFSYVGGELSTYTSQVPPLDIKDHPVVRADGRLRGGEGKFGRLATEVGRVDYLAIPVSVPRGDGVSRGVFFVAEFTGLHQRQVDELVRVASGVGLGVLLLASAVASAVAGRILQPVRLVTDAARSISETDLSRRIDVRGADEISRLAVTFNEMLDRLETAFDAQRNFVDDASHELRTPITIIRGHLELLGDDPDERRETVAIVTDELDRMNGMVNALLMLAKAERSDFLDLATVDLSALIDDLLTKAAALGDRDWRLAARAGGLVVADRQRLTQGIVQLAQNACQHTADGDLIAVGSEVVGDQVHLW
ncbi:MAG: histidine kinase dimerization/phospho-acceptor domain-containing protein, partial [Egibacteraceae bacterium]